MPKAVGVESNISQTWPVEREIYWEDYLSNSRDKLTTPYQADSVGTEIEKTKALSLHHGSPWIFDFCFSSSIWLDWFPQDPPWPAAPSSLSDYIVPPQSNTIIWVFSESPKNIKNLNYSPLPVNLFPWVKVLPSPNQPWMGMWEVSGNCCIQLISNNILYVPDTGINVLYEFSYFIQVTTVCMGSIIIFIFQMRTHSLTCQIPQLESCRAILFGLGIWIQSCAIPLNLVLSQL